MTATPPATRHSLLPHPASPPSPAREISVSVGRFDYQLLFSFRLAGELAGLLLPERRDRARVDELWRHTCFEVFVGSATSPGYVEYNFSPSDEWAAYRFTGYRAGMQPHDWREPPGFVCRTGADIFELSGGVHLGWQKESRARVGVTAVIEDRSGRLSYWALKHPAEKPDFHDPNGFILDL